MFLKLSDGQDGLANRVTSVILIDTFASYVNFCKIHAKKLDKLKPIITGSSLVASLLYGIGILGISMGHIETLQAFIGLFTCLTVAVLVYELNLLLLLYSSVVIMLSIDFAMKLKYKRNDQVALIA